jgi:hypothetical protein
MTKTPALSFFQILGTVFHIHTGAVLTKSLEQHLTLCAVTKKEIQ